MSVEIGAEFLPAYIAYERRSQVHNPSECKAYYRLQGALYRAAHRAMFSKKNEEYWRAAATWASLLGLVSVGIPGVDFATGFVMGAIAASYDCNYGHPLCVADLIGMFTAGVPKIPITVGRIIKGISAGNYILNIPGDSERTK